MARAQKLAAGVYHELNLSQRDHKLIWYPLRNKGLEYKLVDQLAAGYSFLKRLLDTAEQNNIFKTQRARTVKKFRR